jgi:hypothetical protein
MDNDRKESTVVDDKLVQLAINTIRTLSIDAVQAAQSGHPGTPDGSCPGGLHHLEPGDEFLTR